ncbi:helix-turn-helix domain-containing protein [Ideonella benzenivorans]|uniref:helix-turn-helix domain-containing protein n=1 Tax=Ideonella benzenivorans TaxID=2831643 RepID=UPI002872C759|nr:LysR family transcriptional regulator [Ideonella benzenivorans]
MRPAAQTFDWENLRHFLAVTRTGTLSGAARALQVDHAIVSRRLAALEAELHVTLVERLPRACRLTPMGRWSTAMPRRWRPRPLRWSARPRPARAR